MDGEIGNRAVTDGRGSGAGEPLAGRAVEAAASAADTASTSAAEPASAPVASEGASAHNPDPPRTRTACQRPAQRRETAMARPSPIPSPRSRLGAGEALPSNPLYSDLSASLARVLRHRRFYAVNGSRLARRARALSSSGC